MSYNKVDQTPFAANLSTTNNEFVVQLADTLDYVAVYCLTGMEENSGNPIFNAYARAVDGTGLTRNDATGQPITSCISHTSNPDEVTALGGMSGVQKQCLLAVLGETTTVWNDPLHATTMQNASIRVNLATAAHVGPAAPASLL